MVMVKVMVMVMVMVIVEERRKKIPIKGITVNEINNIDTIRSQSQHLEST